MKLSVYLSIVCAAFSVSFATPAHAEVFFAPGVSAEKGWFDTNKAYHPGAFFTTSGVPDTTAIARYFPYQDTTLCWAASAANIIEYMKARCGIPTEYSSSYQKAEAESDPQRRAVLRSVVQYASYEEFLKNFHDSGCYAEDAIAWYACGHEAYHYSPMRPTPRFPGKETGGFYKKTAGDTLDDFKKNVLACHYQVYGAACKNPTALFQDAIKVGPISLRLLKFINYNFRRETGHTITCWGFKTDDNGAISELYVTDSDDGVVQLRTLTVRIDPSMRLMHLGEKGNVSLPMFTHAGKSVGTATRSYEGRHYVIMEIAAYKNFIVK